MRGAYEGRSLTLRQMAAEAGCGLRTIARWMDLHGIPTDRSRIGPRLAGPANPKWKGGIPNCQGCGKPCKRGRQHCQSCRVRTGDKGSNWRGDAIEYAGAHGRVVALRGLASSHPCKHCGGGGATEWAYDHLDPDERRNVVGRDRSPFSLKPEHYVPLCVPCHRHFDQKGVRRSSRPCSSAHGTYSRYSNHGCRCQVCIEGAKEYRRIRRLKKLASEVGQGPAVADH